MKRKIIVTKDGSSSLFVPELNETYHSIHGAVQEAKHVFLKMGIGFKDWPSYKVLEIGFGTGLNAGLTLELVFNKSLEVCYHGIEKYPIDSNELELLNYTEFYDDPKTFELLHEGEWGQELELANGFKLKKIESDILDASIDKDYNVIFFDAFAPNKQEKMWTEEVFQKMFDSLVSGGCLVTYCCQGKVRRTMLSVGFEVEKVEGPPGKREMLRAIKP